MNKKDIQKRLTYAIRNGYTVYFHYKGDKQVARGWRKVAPVVLGISPRGNILLRAYQRQGPTKSDHRPNWRLFNIEKIQKISVSTAKFVMNRADYNKTGDKSLTKILVQYKIGYRRQRKVLKEDIAEYDIIDDDNDEKLTPLESFKKRSGIKGISDKLFECTNSVFRKEFFKCRQ